MHSNKGNIHVSWSRHIGVSPEPDQVPNREAGVVTRARRHLQKIKATSKISGNCVDPRKAKSDSNLWNGANQERVDGESWDSQSDPGSISPQVSNGFNPRPAAYEEIIGDGKQIRLRRLGKKFKLQGRGKGSQCELQRRHGKHGIAGGNGDFVVNIPDKVVPPSDIATCYQVPKYVHSYFDFMYYSCLSSYKWDRKEEDETKCRYALNIIQKVSLHLMFYHKALFT